MQSCRTLIETRTRKQELQLMLRIGGICGCACTISLQSCFFLFSSQIGIPKHHLTTAPLAWTSSPRCHLRAARLDVHSHTDAPPPAALPQRVNVNHCCSSATGKQWKHESSLSLSITQRKASCPGNKVRALLHRGHHKSPASQSVLGLSAQDHTQEQRNRSLFLELHFVRRFREKRRHASAHQELRFIGVRWNLSKYYGNTWFTTLN